MKLWHLALPVVSMPVLLVGTNAQSLVNPWGLAVLGATFLIALVAVLTAGYEVVGGKDGHFRFGPCVQRRKTPRPFVRRRCGLSTGD
jgi:hypothetical protein